MAIRSELCERPAAVDSQGAHKSFHFVVAVMRGDEMGSFVVVGVVVVLGDR